MTKTLFMIHGMWGGPWYWENYKLFFERKGYRCITTTLRFHNLDPKCAPDPRLGITGLLDYADDLENEIRQLGVKPIVIGHSMGGLLAQILGSRGLAEALILLTPVSPAGIMAQKLTAIRGFWRVFSKWGFWKNPMRQSFEDAVYSLLHLLPPQEQKKAYDKFVYESGRAASEIVFWPFDPRSASKVDESKVTCPTLVIGGTQDRITPASVVRQVARKYQAVSSYKEFERHAHWVVSEPGWQEIAEYVSGWIEQNGL